MNDDFIDFVSLLNSLEVEYILVGGYAYMYNVEPRFTNDIDFWVKPTRENLEKLNKVSEQFLGTGFDVGKVLELTERPELGFKFAGTPPNMIEILIKLPGLEFDQARANARLFSDKNISFPAIHPHDQIRNKRLSSRTKDKLDLENLIKLYGEPTG